MKITNHVIIALCVVIGISVTRCSTPSEKVENAKEKVTDAKENLANEKIAYQDEMDAYKKEAAEKIAINEKAIADFNARISLQKKEAKLAYEQKISSLNGKNSDLKKNIADFKADSKESWDQFKIQVNRDLEDLEVAIKDFSLTN